jgi:hypothetical protein
MRSCHPTLSKPFYVYHGRVFRLSVKNDSHQELSKDMRKHLKVALGVRSLHALATTLHGNAMVWCHQHASSWRSYALLSLAALSEPFTECLCTNRPIELAALAQ